ncbi:MAG: ferritin-like domain-containing protein [Terriglobia bacterium]
MDNEKEKMLELPKGPTDRRRFMKVAGATGLAAAAGATWLGRASKASAQMMNGINDFDILNFALNLEYLEAEFYTVATTGKTLAQTGGFTLTGAGSQGTVSGGHQVNFGANSTLQKVAMELALDEQTHVNYLRAALGQFGQTPIAEPAINLDALGVGFGSVAEFLTLARAFEDVGVTAYGGAAPLLLNKTVLGAAARILAVEAEHSGNIRLQVALNNVPTTALDGVDILPPPSGTQYFSDVQRGLAQIEVRTPGQVLFIVYGFKAHVTSGGFYPAGVNGVINTSSASA